MPPKASGAVSDAATAAAQARRELLVKELTARLVREGMRKPLSEAEMGALATIGFHEIVLDDRIQLAESIYRGMPALTAVRDILDGVLHNSWVSTTNKHTGATKPMEATPTHAWLTFNTEVEHELHVYGICVTTVSLDSAIGLAPRVIPMRMVRVFMRTLLEGTREYLVFPAAGSTEPVKNDAAAKTLAKRVGVAFDDTDPEELQRTPMRRIHVVESDRVPTHRHLNSRILSLAPVIMRLRVVEEASVRAIKSRAQPLMAVRQAASTVGQGREAVIPEASSISRVSGRTDRGADAAANAYMAMLEAVNNAKKGVLNDRTRIVDTLPQHHARAGGTGEEELGHVLQLRLREGAQIDPGVSVALEPTDIAEYRRAANIAVAVAFGIPASYIGDPSSHGTGIGGRSDADRDMEMFNTLSSIIRARSSRLNTLIHEKLIAPTMQLTRVRALAQAGITWDETIAHADDTTINVTARATIDALRVLADFVPPAVLTTAIRTQYGLDFEDDMAASSSAATKGASGTTRKREKPDPMPVDTGSDSESDSESSSGDDEPPPPKRKRTEEKVAETKKRKKKKKKAKPKSQRPAAPKPAAAKA